MQNSEIKSYYERNKEKIKLQRKIYYKKNKVKIDLYHYKYINKRKHQFKQYISHDPPFTVTFH